MARIKSDCIGFTALSEASIESIYINYGSDKLVRKLCLSHERLREELAGANKVIEVMDKKQRHGCYDANCKECDE